MRRINQILKNLVLATMLCSLIGAMPASLASADTTSIPSLVISQLKITSSNGQLIVLYNATGNGLDISKYQLEYFNSYDLTKATSSRLIALSGTLAPHSYYIVSDDTQPLCYSAVVSSMSLGFSSTAGYLEVLGINQATPGSSVAPSLEDYVGWSKTAASGAQTLPTSTAASLLRQPFDLANKPSIKTAGTGTWLQVKPDTVNPCNLVTNVTAPKPVITAMNILLPSIEPPFTVVEDEDLSDVDMVSSSAKLPKSDEGLMAPKITELLPNPDSTGDDTTDEFIEIYNPNPTSFDLTGFSLKTGITTMHTYVFPSGTTLPSLSFAAFYSKETKLSLSNTTSQAQLIDPMGNMISDTDIYLSAKDGQAWILANGIWDWSITPTPNMANIVHIAAQTKTATTQAKIATSTASPKVKQIKVTKQTSKKVAAPKVPKAKKPKKTAVLGATTTSSQNAPQKTPIHVWTLALVGSLALLYAGYEYRADISNGIYQLRRNLKARRAPRP